jgi:hypothetical protein
MSKMDALRAMREARYEQAMARAAKPTATAKAAKAAPATKRPAAKPADTAPPAAQQEAALCGHRAISGRTCTREQGHAAKSHRYS